MSVRPYETQVDGVIVKGLAIKLPGFFREYSVSADIGDMSYSFRLDPLLNTGVPGYIAKNIVLGRDNIMIPLFTRKKIEGRTVEKCFDSAIKACVKHYKQLLKGAKHENPIRTHGKRNLKVVRTGRCKRSGRVSRSV